MSELNLYNKYRPALFKDVAQPGVVKVLQAQVRTGKYVSTYMLSGPGGTGKTTLARIMAMAMMSKDRKPGSDEPVPTGEVESMIRRGAHRDVFEINCAMHGLVDDVRDMITERVRSSPTMGEFKVFILDEAHMLSEAAQNALLKTTEEPPPYCKFFFCTTNPQKVISTIRSRCQHHLLHRVADKALFGILQTVCEGEGFEYDEGALEVITEQARGGVRTALAILEQVSLIGVTDDNVREVLGHSPRAFSIELLNCLVMPLNGQNQTKEASRKLCQILETCVSEGKDVKALIEEAGKTLSVLTKSRLLGTSGSTYLDKLSPHFQGQYILQSADALMDTLVKIRNGVDGELAAQVVLLQYIRKIGKDSKKEAT
jgi:DNA polymerase III subunit gamma/tau